MRWFDSMLTAIAPESALKRAQARHMLRAYEAVAPGKLRKKSRDRRTASAIARTASADLRTQARHLDENHDLARGILNVLVANIIGRGIQIEPQVKTKNGELNDPVNQLLTNLWRDWCYAPEVTAELNWAAVERLACRSWLRDGEVFAKLITGIDANINHISQVPFSIELIEADYVPFGPGFPAQNAYDGIERDDWGRAKAFHIAKRNNSDILPSQAFYRIDAVNVIHLKHSDRVRQNRGVSVFASVMTRLEDIKDYEESERIAAKIAASMAAFIKKGNPDFYAPSSDGSPRQLRMSPGMIFDDLLPGEEIGTIDTNRPNTNLESYRQGQLKAVAAGTGAGYSSISRNYDGSYSAQRQEMVETSVLYGTMRDHFIERFSRPIWRKFIETVQATAMIKLADVDIKTLDNADFRGPGLPWIDPLKEINAANKAVRGGFRSRSQIIREYGNNPTEVRAQIKAERLRDETDNLIFESDYANDKKPASIKTAG